MKGKDQNDENELHGASQGGNVAIIEKLFSLGLDINSKDSEGNTPLMIAAFTGKMEAVTYLFDKGADASLKGKYGRNLLQNASWGGNVAIIKTMLSRGFDINSKDSNGDTPLMIAALCGKMEAVTYLLDKGADASLKASMEGTYCTLLPMVVMPLSSRQCCHVVWISIQDSNGKTPLMIAATNGKAEAVEYLLSRGARWSCTSYLVILLSVLRLQSSS